MPRGRKKKKKETKAAKSKSVSQAGISPPLEIYDLDIETYGLDRLHSFMRAREDIASVAYRIPTANLARDGLVAKYRGEMISAIQNFARNRGQIISVQHINIDVLPLGPEAIIKAWAYMRDVDGKVKRRSSAPDDPLAWSVEGVKI